MKIPKFTKIKVYLMSATSGFKILKINIFYISRYESVLHASVFLTKIAQSHMFYKTYQSTRKQGRRGRVTQDESFRNCSVTCHTTMNMKRGFNH